MTDFDTENASDPWGAEERCLLGSLLLDGQRDACLADVRELGLTPAMLDPFRGPILARLLDGAETAMVVVGGLPSAERRAEVFRCIREASVPGALFRRRVQGVISRHAIRSVRSGSDGIANKEWLSTDPMLEAVNENVLAHLERARSIAGSTTDDSVASALEEAGAAGGLVCSLPYIGDSLRRGRLVVLGARPKIGKSIVGLQVAALAAREGRVLLASLEMSRSEQAQRLVRQVGENDARALMLDLVDHSKAPTIEALHRYARHKRLRYGDIALIVVDYAQIARCENEKRLADHERVATISRACKLMAQELNCCVLLLSQLKAASEQREWPRSSDLAQSDALQRDANHVYLLHRPHFYSRGGDRDAAVMIHDISRHGGTGMTKIRFDVTRLRFVEDDRDGL